MMPSMGAILILISIHALLAESDVTVLGIQHRCGISIHALLAESDSGYGQYCIRARISIHALLAESDQQTAYFFLAGETFLSTLSLRRATSTSDKLFMPSHYFYPRSPCGERLGEGE